MQSRWMNKWAGRTGLPQAVCCLFCLFWLSAVPCGRADLGEALDATALTWTTSATAPWEEDFEVSHDGVSAARSGLTDDNGVSWLRTTVTGPGVISFWWTTASEAESDVLRFKVGGLTVAELSGENDWRLVSIPIPQGPQQLEWAYEKDDAYAVEPDAGWVDSVIFAPGAAPPYLFRHPAGQTVMAGEGVTLSAGAIGGTPLQFQWWHGAQPLSGATGAVLNLDPVLVSQAGSYYVVVTNQYGSVTSQVAQLQVIEDPMAAALNAPGLVFGNGPSVLWTVQNAVTHDGQKAAQTGPMFPLQYCALWTTVQGPGRLSFWWKISADEEAMVLTFLMNNEEMDFITGETGWIRQTYEVPAGQVSLEWICEQWFASAVAEDLAWLDEVIYTPLTPPQLSAPGWTGNAFSAKVATKTGRNYALEYKNNLNDAVWTALPAVPGDGTTKVLSDPSASAARRFYRIKETD